MKTINQWKTEVKNYNLELNKILKENQELKNLFYGFEVIDGELINNPQILFIGINPGAGDINNIERDIFETERISYLDIFNDDYRIDYPNTYHLAEKTIKFFRLAGWNDEKIKEVFLNSTKSNFYHIATENVDDLNKLFRISGIKEEYFKKSAEFTVDLVKILKPKIVILEGKSVYDNLLGEWFPNKKDWVENQFTYVKDENMNTMLLAYNRRNFTNENRESFVKKLKELLSIHKI